MTARAAGVVPAGAACTASRSAARSRSEGGGGEIVPKAGAGGGAKPAGATSRHASPSRR